MRLSWLSPFLTLLILLAVRMFFRALSIYIFFSSGIFFSTKNASIFLITISPSLFPVSVDDFKSDFSSGATLPCIPSVAIIEAAKR